MNPQHLPTDPARDDVMAEVIAHAFDRAGMPGVPHVHVTADQLGSRRTRDELEQLRGRLLRYGSELTLLARALRRGYRSGAIPAGEAAALLAVVFAAEEAADTVAAHLGPEIDWRRLRARLDTTGNAS